MLAYWSSKFIFTDFPHEHVKERVFPLAIKLVAGTSFPLAPLFLSHLYQKLDQIARDDRDGAGQEGLITIHRGPTELLLTTTAQSIVARDDLFGPSREKYSPDRVKRQFSIDQDVPSHLSFGGNIGECITSFTRTVVTSGGDKLSGSLGKKDSAGSATLAFLAFWK
ncbi:hypothetical protein ACLB2K_007006 [Fragaria x ananassa]